ncbi:MAG TPA: hypothetical protein DDX33_07045 [Rikenellaceae bacterium]|nr:hypothetical protein [Rikenellaceae bacterium]
MFSAELVHSGMKEFLKTTLAVICGILVTSVLFLFVVAGFFGSLLAFGESTPVLPKSGVLVVDMSKIVLSEQTQYLPIMPGNFRRHLGVIYFFLSVCHFVLVLCLLSPRLRMELFLP